MTKIKKTVKTKSPYDLFKNNENLEAGQGVMLQYPSFSITIHRAGGSNKRFANVLSTKMKPYRHQLDRGIMDDEISARILRESYAEAVIVGWNGVTDAAGKEMQYSRENVIKLLTDLPDLFADIRTQAENVSIFREEQEQADEKN